MAVLHTIGLHACDPWWRLGPERTRAWNDHALWLLLEGRGRVETPEGVYAMEPGACLVLRGGEDYRFTQDPGHRFRHWYAHFTDEGPPLARFRQLEAHQFLAELLQRAWDARQTAAPAAAIWFDAVLLELARLDTQSVHPAVAGRPRLQEIAARLRSDPVGSPSIAALARGLGLSTDHFTRLFRAAIGASPRAVLVAARLELARHLLRDSTLTVRQVATSCGFSDPAFFGRHFAAHAGCSPGAWRRRMRST
jgi:AraC-like DNA-binding protein